MGAEIYSKAPRSYHSPLSVLNQGQPGSKRHALLVRISLVPRTYVPINYTGDRDRMILIPDMDMTFSDIIRGYYIRPDALTL